MIIVQFSILFWSLLGFCGFTLREKQESFNKNEMAGLSVKISSLDQYNHGQPIRIRLKITNQTDSLREVNFTETHPYHKQLPYPIGIAATITDLKGVKQCSYENQYILWSTVFRKEEIQFITLKPGEQIVRELTLNKIVYKCQCDEGNGFRAGYYLVTLSVHNKLSNQLKIEIKA